MFKSLNIFGSSRSDKNKKKSSKFLVTKEKSIVALLSQAYKKKAFLSLSFKDVDEAFNTAIIGTYPSQKFIALDELVPGRGHDIFLKKKVAEVTGRLEGVEMRFLARLIEAGSKSGLAFYKIAIPEKLYYKQHREYYRVSVVGSQVPFLGYGKGSANALQGYLNDISIGGIGVTLGRKISLNRDDILSPCKISLGGDNVSFDLKVCFINSDRPGGGISFGGEFHDIATSDRAKIEKFITEVQRKKAKNT